MARLGTRDARRRHGREDPAVVARCSLRADNPPTVSVSCLGQDGRDLTVLLRRPLTRRHSKQVLLCTRGRVRRVGMGWRSSEWYRRRRRWRRPFQRACELFLSVFFPPSKPRTRGKRFSLRFFLSHSDVSQCCECTVDVTIAAVAWLQGERHQELAELSGFR